MSDELRVDSGALIFATLADVYISSGMIDEAISILKDGLARNPNYHLAQIILGRAYYLKGELDDAKKTIESVYEQVKDSESANLYLGHCYRDSGQKEKARGYYEATLKINPENMEALKELEKLIPDFTPPPSVPIAKPQEPEPAEVKEKVQTETRDEEEEEALSEGGEEGALAVAEEEPAAAVEVPEEPAVLSEEKKGTEIETVGALIEELPEKKEEIETVPLEALDKPVKRLVTLDTVKGAFISTKDGLLIKNYGKAEYDIESVCASVAAICMDVDESFRLLKRGGLTRCIIEKPDETLCVMAVGDSLFTVITEVEAKPGLVFVYARKIIEDIEEILG